MPRRKTQVEEETTEKKVTKAKVEKKPEPKIYRTKVALNLRKTAGDMTPDAIITVIPPDTKIVGLGDSSESTDGTKWVSVRFGKNTGWVNSQFID
jgi:hypothetical protein